MKKDHGRYCGAFVLLIVLLACMVIWNIYAGSVSMSVGEILRILFGPVSDGTEYGIVWNIRLPRILAAAILGDRKSVG